MFRLHEGPVWLGHDKGVNRKRDSNNMQGRAVGAVTGATRAFGRRTQGVWGAGPPTAGCELSGYQALKPPQSNIDLTKSLKYESFVLPILDYF